MSDTCGPFRPEVTWCRLDLPHIISTSVEDSTNALAYHNEHALAQVYSRMPDCARNIRGPSRCQSVCARPFDSTLYHIVIGSSAHWMRRRPPSTPPSRSAGGAGRAGTAGSPRAARGSGSSGSPWPFPGGRGRRIRGGRPRPRACLSGGGGAEGGRGGAAASCRGIPLFRHPESGLPPPTPHNLQGALEALVWLCMRRVVF